MTKYALTILLLLPHLVLATDIGSAKDNDGPSIKALLENNTIYDKEKINRLKKAVADNDPADTASEIVRLYQYLQQKSARAQQQIRASKRQRKNIANQLKQTTIMYQRRELQLKQKFQNDLAVYKRTCLKENEMMRKSFSSNPSLYEEKVLRPEQEPNQ